MFSPDLRLLAGSRGVDAGDPADYTPTDIDGRSRPQGGGPDIGAAELETWAARADRVCAAPSAHPVVAPKTRTRARLVVYVRRFQSQIAGVVKKHGAIRLVRHKAETRALNLERALLRQLKTVAQELHSGRTFKRDFARLTAKRAPLARRAPRCARIVKPAKAAA